MHKNGSLARLDASNKLQKMRTYEDIRNIPVYISTNGCSYEAVSTRAMLHLHGIYQIVGYRVTTYKERITQLCSQHHTTPEVTAVLGIIGDMLDTEYDRVHHRLHNLSGFIQALEFKINELAEVVTPDTTEGAPDDT